MPSPLIATVGGTTSNSYADVAYADAYFALRLNSTDWASIVTGTKEQALMTATARLEQERWKGQKATATQALDWPRLYVWDDKNGVYFSDTAIPEVVKQATCELGFVLYSDPSILRQSGADEFKSFKVGPVEAVVRDSIRSGDLPYEVISLLEDLLITSNYFSRISRA